MKVVGEYTASSEGIKKITLNTEEKSLKNTQVSIEFSDARLAKDVAQSLDHTLRSLRRLTHERDGTKVLVVGNKITLTEDLVGAADILSMKKLMSETEKNRLVKDINGLISESINKSMEELSRDEKAQPSYNPRFLGTTSKTSGTEVEDSKPDSSHGQK